MKKLFYLAVALVAAVGFTSCEEKESELPTDNNDIENYVGTLSVTKPSDTSATPYIKDNVKFDFDDDTNTLTMWKVSFDEMMPLSVDIVIKNVPEVSDDVYMIDSITATLADGEPAPSFISDLKDVVITEVNDKLGVVFTVDVAAGPVSTTYNVAYAGIDLD